MSVFQRAVLSVAPERLEQFTIEMKKSISKKESRKRRKKSDRPAGSREHKKRKTTSIIDENKSRSKAGNSKKNVKKRSGKKASRSRSRERRRSRKSDTTKKKERDKYKNDSDFDPKDLDLSVPLQPLSSMVKDRNAMLEAAFSIIKGPKLTSMLPDILKLTPLKDIKQLCEEQLGVMSSKRILHILSGTEMESSSGTDSSDDGRSGTRVRDVPVIVKSSQDHSLQANLIDSTTSDHAGPSMLFPSALRTALTTTEGSCIPARQIDNGKNEDDNVSTSTEPNLIYTEGLHDDQTSNSGTEDGEVQSSAEEDGADDESGASPDVEAVELVKENHPGEEVLVEVEEEIEEVHEEEQSRGTCLEEQNVFKESPSNDEGQNTDENAKGDAPQRDCAQKTNETVSAAGADGLVQADYAGKSQLEILELELRARAIRSLMNAAKAGKLKPAQ